MQIVAEGLACVRGGREGFRNLHFAVDRGEMLAITGPNGAGKSSLLRVVAGLVRPREGRLILRGGDAELSIGEQAHYVGHQDAFKPSLTVQENLVFWSDFLGGGGEVATSLACVGLYALAHLPARYLSAGQRPRAPLDQPGSPLDAAGQRLLADIIVPHVGKGGIILAAVHGPLPQAARELKLAGAGGLAGDGGGGPQQARPGAGALH